MNTSHVYDAILEPSIGCCVRSSLLAQSDTLETDSPVLPSLVWAANFICSRPADRIMAETLVQALSYTSLAVVAAPVGGVIAIYRALADRKQRPAPRCRCRLQRRRGRTPPGHRRSGSGHCRRRIRNRCRDDARHSPTHYTHRKRGADGNAAGVAASASLCLPIAHPSLSRL